MTNVGDRRSMSISSPAVPPVDRTAFDPAAKLRYPG